MIKNFLNPEGHQNLTNGSKVTAILLKEWISPIDVEGLRSTGLPRLVYRRRKEKNRRHILLFKSYTKGQSGGASL